MARFALVWIETPQTAGGFDVLTTHPQIIRELLAVAAQIVPGAKFWDSDASHRVHFHALKRKDRLVAFELVRYLCDQGWEPFEAHLESRPYVGGTVYLRKAF